MNKQTQFRTFFLPIMILSWSYLNTEVATVNVIPEKQVPRCGWWSSHFKQFHKIKELPMDVTTHWKTTTPANRYRIWDSTSMSASLCVYVYVSIAHSCSGQRCKKCFFHFGDFCSVKQQINVDQIWMWLQRSTKFWNLIGHSALTLTAEHQNQIGLYLSPSECLCQIWRNSFKNLLRYSAREHWQMWGHSDLEIWTLRTKL